MLSAVFLLSAFDCSKNKNELSVTPTSLTFDARETQKKSVVITTDASTWDYQVIDDWVTAEKQDNILYISLQNYTNTTQARTTVITISAGNAPAVPLLITQNAKDKDGLSVSPNALYFTATETATKTVAVATNAPSWDITAGASWITAIKSGSNINVSVLKNDSRSERSANVTVKGGDAADIIFLVTQEGATPYLTVSRSSYSFASYAAGSTSATITSNVSWTASSSATSWLSVSPTSGSNDGSLTINVTTNSSTTTDRNGVITINSEVGPKTITITQPKRDAPQPVNPPQVRFRKTSNNARTYEMAIATTSNTALAYYQWVNNTGTTQYFTITAGNHKAMINEGGTTYTICWDSNCNIQTYNFQNNYRYTFEYDGTDYWMRNDGSYNLPNEGFNAPQLPISDKAVKMTLIEGLNSLQDLNK